MPSSLLSELMTTSPTAMTLILCSPSFPGTCTPSVTQDGNKGVVGTRPACSLHVPPLAGFRSPFLLTLPKPCAPYPHGPCSGSLGQLPPSVSPSPFSVWSEGSPYTAYGTQSPSGSPLPLGWCQSPQHGFPGPATQRTLYPTPSPPTTLTTLCFSCLCTRVSGFSTIDIWGPITLRCGACAL